MAEIQIGTGVIYGTDGVSMAGTGVYATGKVLSVGYNLGGEYVEVRGQDGKVITVIIPDSVEEIDVEIVPTGSTKAAAIACYILPARGALVTFTDTSDAENSTGRTFIFKSGTKNKTNTDKGTMRFNLTRYDDTNHAVVAAS